MTEKSTRKRTVEWSDPHAAAAHLDTMSGREYLDAIVRGEIPDAPMWVLQGFRLTEVDEGYVCFEGEPGEHLFNPIASVHGGFAASLIDSAASCAIHTMVPKGAGYTTISLSVDLMRGLTEKTGPLRCEGRAVRVGRRVAVADADIKDTAGKVYARGSVNCIILQQDG
jgi:uncharacterized protein (TIGR00369 family)